MLCALHLLAGKDETLLLRWNALFLLDALLDSVHLVCGLNVNLDLLASQGLYCYGLDKAGTISKRHNNKNIISPTRIRIQ